jgi:hypothetical protein
MYLLETTGILRVCEQKNAHSPCGESVVVLTLKVGMFTDIDIDSLQERALRVLIFKILIQIAPADQITRQVSSSAVLMTVNLDI